MCSEEAVLADDLVGHCGQIGVQVAAQHVAQQRAQVVGELGGERVELGVDRQAGDDGALECNGLGDARGQRRAVLG
jgi:hypothetical protein